MGTVIKITAIKASAMRVHFTAFIWFTPFEKKAQRGGESIQLQVFLIGSDWPQVGIGGYCPEILSLPDTDSFPVDKDEDEGGNAHQ